jgi:HAD superfamily hydrolase (TIGR01490 family)
VSRKVVAAFDFDGTMTRRDTLVPFLATVAGRGSVIAALAAEAPRFAYAATGRGDRDAAKIRVLRRLLAGRAYADVTGAGRAFGARLARRGISAQARDRLAWHRRAGHEIAIVSASLDVYLVEVAHQLGVGHVLCTALDVDDQERCTGLLRGRNCRGAEKVERLRTLLDGEDVELWAYGNSAGDEEMLALAQHPVRVRRGVIRPPAPSS